MLKFLSVFICLTMVFSSYAQTKGNSENGASLGVSTNNGLNSEIKDESEQLDLNESSTEEISEAENDEEGKAPKESSVDSPQESSKELRQSEGKKLNQNVVAKKMMVKDVNWYFPEIESESKSKSKSRKSTLVNVNLSGSTEPGSKVYIGTKTIPVVISGKVRKFKRSRAIISKNLRIATANTEGIFIYKIKLPVGEVKLPLTVIFPDKNRQNFQLNLFVEKKEVKITNQDNVTRSPAFRKKFGFWFGAGFNYVRMKQTSDDIGSDLLFESFKTPSLYAKIKGNISSRWDLVYTFKLSPGEATSGVTTVNQGTYNWLTNTLEARWSPTSWQTKIFNNKGQWALRFGAQHHTLPYIDRVSAGVADIVENSVTMASLGGQYVEVLNRNWDFEFFMRYQHPLSNGDNFDVESSFAFDGSLGLIRSFSEGWKAGIFWYGQLQNYSISAHDSVANLDIEGENSYFYSNVDLRLGYTF